MKVKQPTPTQPEAQPQQSGVINEATSSTIPDEAMYEVPQHSPDTTLYESYERFDNKFDEEQEHFFKTKNAKMYYSHGLKVWKVNGLELRLTALEAVVAVKRGLYGFEDFEIYTSQDDPGDQGPADPITGALSAALGAAGTIAQRAGDYPLLFAKVLEAKEGDEARKDIADFAKDSEKGVTGIIGAGLRAPMDITHNVARGFHNLPKIYGDEVRPVEKVTDVQSGLQAAGKGFGLGLWDGISGLVTQPVKGAQEGGFMGGLVGLGKGIAGAAFKPAAGAVGIPGYAFKGIYEEVQKARGIDTAKEREKEVREQQMVQGFKEWDSTTGEERIRILEWLKTEIEDIETMNF